MPRVKTPRVVLGFASLDDAMAVEEHAAAHGLPGRIVPVPSEVSAGCGLAWMAPLQERERLLDALDKGGLCYEGAYEVWMY